MNSSPTASVKHRLLHWFHARFPDPKAPYTILVLLLGMVACLINAQIAVDPITLAACLITSGLLALLLLWFANGLHIMTLTQLGLWVGWVHLFITTWLDGGIYSSKNLWLLVLMVTQYYVVSRRMGLVWMLLAVVSLMAQSWFGLIWPPSWPQLTGFDRATMSLSDFLLPTIAIYLVPQYFQRLYEDSIHLSQQRQDELQAKQRELEHTLVMREHFIASVSHELRTPMNAILGLNTLLLERVKDKPQAQKVLAYTRQSADHLMTVINDVLDYSQFQFGQITARVERFELRGTVQAAFELFKPRIESTRLLYECQIDADVPHWVETDRHRLMQVLVNLLGNAIKFTHRGSVTLRVRKVDQGVEFSVEDTGIGIDAAQQAHIFERFSQANNSIQSEYGGSGLGLTISLRLVQMLKGRMSLDSRVGRGSRFWFWLPLENQEAPVRQTAVENHTTQHSSRTLRFLLVDDHPVNRLLAKQVLLSEWPGSTVDECGDGAKAVEALQQGARYDLMLVDMVMPVMDGIEATTWVRSHQDPQISRMAVLGLTANVNEQDLARFWQAGLNGMLLKPFDLERMRADVNRLVNTVQ